MKAINQRQYEIIEYRHSEVIQENGFPIEPFLRGILCRTQAERETLLFLLKQYSARLYNTYRDKILYKPTLKCFYYNGIFLKSVLLENDTLNIYFNDPEQRVKSYHETLNIELNVELIYKKSNGSIMRVSNVFDLINYDMVRSRTIILNKTIDYDVLGITIYLDGIVMYQNEITIDNELF